MFGRCSYIDNGPTGTVCVFYFHILVDIYPEKMSLSSIGRTIIYVENINEYINKDLIMIYAIIFIILILHEVFAFKLFWTMP